MPCLEFRDKANKDVRSPRRSLVIVIVEVVEFFEVSVVDGVYYKAITCVEVGYQCISTTFPCITGRSSTQYEQ